MTPLAPMTPGGSHGKPLQALPAALPPHTKKVSPNPGRASSLQARVAASDGQVPPKWLLRPSSHLLPFLAWVAYDGRNDVKLPGLDTTSIIRQRAEFIYTRSPPSRVY